MGGRLGGRIVGCGKLTFLTPVDAWFEGLRKDPDLAEKGVTAAVTSYFLSKLAGRKNLASITANERQGFHRCLTLSRKTWNATRAELEALSVGEASASGLEVQRITRGMRARRPPFLTIFSPTRRGTFWIIMRSS